MALRGKNINLFLMDGEVNGRIKCTIPNWTGLAFKIPRTSLDLCKYRPKLKQTGIYMLFGGNDSTGKQAAYVGQAGVRKNGEGILNRLQEHNRNPKKDYWNEAIVITTSNDSMGPTEISYLEHRFCQIAIEANRYEVKNGNDPTPGNPSEEKMSELEDFIDYARVVVGMLGHKVFVPLISEEITPIEVQEFICTRNGVMAFAVRTSDGFVLKKGSMITDKLTNSCPEYVIKKRQQCKDIIDSKNTLTENILFNTPSGASSFVCGASTNGNVEWKTKDGKLLKEVEAEGK